MKTYTIFVNGKEQGIISSANIETFIKVSYPKATYTIDEKKNEVYLKVNIFDLI